MWFLWGFAVFIPLGIVWAFVTGEITTGKNGHFVVISLSDHPIRFLMVIGMLCVMEWFLLRTLLRSSED